VLLGELAGVLRYARQLAPHDPDILRLAGEVAEELGHPSAARAAFIAAIDAAPHSGAPAELYGELGVTELRLGRTDEAIDHLRRAQLPIVRGQTLGAQLLVHLADALAERGDMAGAIDALVGAMPPIAAYYPTETALVSFALAVQYDRDDQRGAAFEVLDRLQRQLQGQFGSVVQTAIAPMRFAPAEDQHYYWGLFYEAAGDWIEARAEWALYAASGGAPFRRRALEHIAELDRLRRAPAAIVNAAKPPAVTP
jgi:tetratricopeptide (TPR) repeat protein